MSSDRQAFSVTATSQPPFRSYSVNRKAGILAAVYIAVLAINLDVTIVNVALPSIATELHADTRDLQWVVDGYNLTFAALVLAAGTGSDGPGPIIAGLAKTLGTFPIPITIVPGGLIEADLDALS